MQWKRNPDSTQGDITPPMTVDSKQTCLLQTHTYTQWLQGVQPVRKMQPTVQDMKDLVQILTLVACMCVYFSSYWDVKTHTQKTEDISSAKGSSHFIKAIKLL